MVNALGRSIPLTFVPEAKTPSSVAFRPHTNTQGDYF